MTRWWWRKRKVKSSLPRQLNARISTYYMTVVHRTVLTLSSNGYLQIL